MATVRQVTVLRGISLTWNTSVKQGIRMVRNIPWTRLRDVGNLTAVKLTVLIPAIGYLILFNEKAMEYLALTPELGGTREVGSVSVRLLLIYFGLCGLAAGATLYSIFCPEIIKRYSSPSNYVASTRESLGTTGYVIAAATVEKFDPAEHENMEVLMGWTDTPASHPDHRPHGWTLSPSEQKEILTFAYTALNDSGANARMATAGFFAIGFFVLAIPSLEVFIRCFGLLVKAFTGV